MRRASPLVVLVTMMALLGLDALPAHAATTHYVNDDATPGTNTGCADPGFTVIQVAVDAAATGDTIQVCGGTYDEQVVIAGKDLTLRGSGPTSIIRPSAPTILDEFYTYPSCVLPGWGGLKLAPEVLVMGSASTTVEDLLIDGSNVTSLPAGANRLSGVLYGESGGTISDVIVNDIKTTGYADRTYVIDVSACEGTARSVNIVGNTIDDYSRTGIQAQGDDLTATIDDNNITGPGSIGPANVPNGIVFIKDAVGSADGNVIHALHHTGTSAASGGLMAFSTTEAGGVTFSDNDVFDTDDGVILASNAANVTVGPDNTLHENEKGVQVENGATNNVITGNTIASSSIVAIQLEGSLNPSPGTNAGPGNVANNNGISGNAAGVINYIGVPNTFDAECNWWDATSGPSGEGIGAGDSVTANVDFDPFLLSSDLDGVCSGVPTLTKDVASVGVDEGQQATNSGTYAAGSQEALTFSVSVGDLDTAGTNTGTWSWSHTTQDGPSGSQIVEIQANNGETGATSFLLLVDNLPPAGTFNAPGTVKPGEAFTPSISGASDPSAPDTSAGLTYAFDCGGGFGAFGASASASCGGLAAGTYIVKGTVRDKDGGQSEYSKVLEVETTQVLGGVVKKKCKDINNKEKRQKCRKRKKDQKAPGAFQGWTAAYVARKP